MSNGVVIRVAGGIAAAALILVIGISIFGEGERPPVVKRPPAPSDGAREADEAAELPALPSRGSSSTVSNDSPRPTEEPSTARGERPDPPAPVVTSGKSREDEHEVYRRKILRKSAEELEESSEVNPEGRELTPQERDLLASIIREGRERIKEVNGRTQELESQIQRAQWEAGNYTIQDPQPDHKFGRPPPEYEGQLVFASWIGGKVKVSRVDVRDYPELEKSLQDLERERENHLQSLLGFFR